MNDEKYVFISDVREKKNISRSSYNKKTHAGKGGRAMMPSDYLSRKERDAMNGEVQAYRINEPMGWKEFKSMPDDIKVLYIKALRNKFNVPDKQIAEMFGKVQKTFVREIKRLGISLGRGGGKKNWDKDGWAAFVCRTSLPKVPEISMEETAIKNQDVDIPPLAFDFSKLPLLPDTTTEVETAIPCSGSMTFDGSAVAALQTVSKILGESRAKLTVIWECEN